MKREGRQHGMIRTQMILPNNKHYTQFQQFQAPHHHQAKVSGKPTNHSKSTSKFGKGRYGGNNNGKDKAKGQQKVKSFDVGLNHRLVSWRVVDDKGYHGLNYVGASASDVLGHLSNYYYHNYEEDDEDEDDGVDEHEFYHDSDDSFGLSDELVIGSCSVGVVVEDEDEDEDDDDGIVDKGKEIDIDDMGICDEDEDDDDDDDMGFCDVGFVIQQLDEDWCLVGELGGD